MTGKDIRLSRIMGNQMKKAFIMPIDHGLSYGPICGLENPYDLIKNSIDLGINAIVLHKGILNKLPSSCLSGNYIIQLSGSTYNFNNGFYKRLISSVEEAMRLGADGVSVQVNLGCDYEHEMLADLGKVSSECAIMGMPLMAMVYNKKEQNNTDIIHAARLAEEIGADIVKIAMPKEINLLEKLNSCIRIPVFIAGGEYNSNVKELLHNINIAIQYGIAGVAIGRNIFSYKNPSQLTKVIIHLLQGEISEDDCYQILENL